MQIHEKYKNWHFKNTFFLILTLVTLLVLSETPFLINAVAKIGNYGYISAFFSGLFFVSIFTVAPASIVLFDLASKLNPILVAVIAGCGAVIGDLLIFNFFKDKVFDELKALFSKFSIKELFKKTFKTPYFSWLLPLIGAFIIASPFPDEIGIGMMGLCNIKRWQFILVTFALNTIGILIVVTIAKTV